MIVPILVRFPLASILTVPAPAPVATLVTAFNVPGALKSAGIERVTAPVATDAVIWFVVPVIDVTPVEEVKNVDDATFSTTPVDVLRVKIS